MKTCIKKVIKKMKRIEPALMILLWGLFIPNLTLGATESSGGGEAVKLKNPLAGTIDSIPGFIQELLDIVLIIGVPIVAVMIIYSGFNLVTAQGDKEKLQKGKDGVLWTIVGAAIILGARVLANAIKGTIEQLQ